MIDRPEFRIEPTSHVEFRFSVIVPTYNRPEHIAACVASLRRLDQPAGGGRFEIVIVNDGGAALPIGIADDGGDGREVRVVEQANAGPATARNTGARLARGTLLAFTDDDCRPEPGWLVAFDDALRAQPEALAGGRTLNAIDSVYAEVSQLLADFVASYFDGGVSGRFFTSNNLAVAREAFLAAGAFDTSFPFSAGEDRELCDRWSAQGRPSVRVEGAVIRHEHALTAWRFVRQHFTYGRGGAAFRRKRAATDRPVVVEPGFYAKSLAHAWRHSPGTRGAMYVALTMLAHASYAAGLLWESRRLR